MAATRLLAVLAGAALLACGGGGGGGASASVPSGFSQCPQSGDVTKISDKDTQGEWKYQQTAGATGGDIEVYAGSSSDCKGMPDIRKGGTAKMLAAAVITYKDSGAAASAAKGMFGVGSQSISQTAGNQSGNATGFGAHSAYVFSGGEGMAVWWNGSKVAAVIGENVAESDFKTFAGSFKSRTS